MQDLLEEKRKLRNEMKKRRCGISDKEKSLYDQRIYERACMLPEYMCSSLVLIYVSYGGESDTIKLIELSLMNKKRTAVPKVHKDGTMDFYIIKSLDELAPGTKGILEPAASEENSVRRILMGRQSFDGIMFVPGLAFDLKMNRLGYGGGYYDKYISFMNSRNVIMVKAALLYECQITEKVPFGVNDMKVDLLVTPDRII